MTASPFPFTTFTPAMGERICEALVAGRALRAICTDAGMPSEATVYRWLREQPGSLADYKVARMAQADGLVDEIIALADERGEAVARSRLMVDARKWATARLAPVKYHDRALEAAAAAHWAPAGRGSAAAMSPQERERRIAELLAKAAGQAGAPGAPGAPAGS